MTLLRLLVPLIVVVLLAWWFFGRRRREPTARPGADKSASDVLPASIVACAHCAVHFPREDAVPDAQGRLFCCEAHRDAATR